MRPRPDRRVGAAESCAHWVAAWTQNIRLRTGPVGGRAGASDSELAWGGPRYGGEGGELEPVRQGPPQWLRAAELDRARAHRLRPAEVVAPDLGHPAQAGR